MSKNIITLIAATVLFAFQSCNKISGNGPVITKTYNQSGFTSVNAGIDGDIYYTQDSNYKLEIHAQSNILDKIETKVVDGELIIQFEKFKYIGRHDHITVYVSSPKINSFNVNGSGTIHALQQISGTDIDLKINGSGNISLAGYTGVSLSGNVNGSGDIQVNGGAVTTEDLHISGSGRMDLLGLSATNVTTNTSGSGKISVNATQRLDVRISGSGDVYYTGYPAVSSSISGSGKVKHL